MTTTIFTTCPFCGNTNEVTVNFKDYLRWQGGDLIQDASPILTLMIENCCFLVFVLSAGIKCTEKMMTNRKTPQTMKSMIMILNSDSTLTRDATREIVKNTP